MSTEPADAPPDPTPALPEVVRARVRALAADALGRLPPEQVPAPLRKVATFAPARRARLAGSKIVAMLESDDDFRVLLGVQVRAAAGELAAALDAGPVPAADPVEAAATAYLLRTSGWQDRVAEVERSLDTEQRSHGARQAADRIDRLQRRVATLQEELDAARLRSRERVERLRQDNDELRRRTGELRARLRTAEKALEDERAVRAADASAAGAVTAAGDSEVRRLRTRVSELEEEVAVARRSVRASRVGETVRAKLLVETLVNAAQGLRRELGLPAVDRLPADTVSGEGAREGVVGSRASSGRGSLAFDDPALLEEVLGLPLAHMVVDGYNVTKNAWPELPLERQRERLVIGVAALQARTGAEVTVVFDAAETQARPLVGPPRGIRVLFSPYGVIADDVIRDLVAAEPPGRNVVVVSTDRAVAKDVQLAGFRVVPSATLAAALRGSRKS